MKILFLLMISSLSCFSQTELVAGDIAILQMNSDGAPQVTKFLALRAMEQGTTITFTDNGWKSDDTFRSGEGEDVWTAPSNIKAGDIIEFTFTNISLSTDGDQLLAYQMKDGSEVFLFAVNNEGSAVWQTDATSENTSALPLGLTNTTNAVAINERDNIKYNGNSTDRKGTISHILTNICDESKWRRSNSTVQDYTRSITSSIRWTGSWEFGGDPIDYFLTRIRSNYDTSTDGEFSSNEIEIRSGSTLTVNSGDLITVTNSIDNLGDIVVEDDGSFIQVINDAPNTGTGYTVNRQTTSLDSKGEYTYWSSPLSGSTLIESVDTHLYYSFNSSTQNWSAETSSSSMTPGVGYAATGPSIGVYPLQHTAVFTGSVFNNGDIPVTLNYSDDGDDTNDAQLIGNPYPSALDADAFLTANTNLGGTLYFWTHNSDDTAGDNVVDDYVYWNGMGGINPGCTGCVVPDGNIASGQGFFAQAIGSGDITFTNDMRIASSGNNDLFYKSYKKDTAVENDRIWLNIDTDSKSNQMLFGYHEKATDGVDRLYDAKRTIGGTGLWINSMLEEEGYAIQGKKQFEAYDEIDLSFETDKTGEHTIEIEKIQGIFEDNKVVLTDRELDVTHNLKKSPYVFNVDLIGEYSERFVLEIGNKRKSNNDSHETVKIYLRRNVLKVRSGSNISKIKIFDTNGRTLYLADKSKKNFNIKLKKLKEANVFIVHLYLESGTVIRKKIFNEN